MSPKAPGPPSPAKNSVHKSNFRNPARYNLAGARHPANGRALPPRSANAFTAVVAVPDPNPDPAKTSQGVLERVTATVNWRCDILEVELKQDLISEQAYAVGRVVQAVFERARGARSGGGCWAGGGDRVDAAWATEAAIVYALDDARKVVAYQERIRRDLGMIDARIIEAVLGDRKTYAQVAADRGRAGDQGRRYYAARFRDALGALAEVWAKGKERA